MTDEQPIQDNISVFEHKDAEALQTALYQECLWVRYNLRSQRAEMALIMEDPDKMQWREMNDRNTADLRRTIAERYQYRTARARPPWTTASRNGIYISTRYCTSARLTRSGNG